MQHPVHPIPRNRLRAVALTATLGAALVALVGCEEGRTTASAPPKPFAGQKLTLSCPDAAFADAITPMAKAWAARTGAEVVVRRETMTPTDETDIGIIPSGHLGEWGEQGLLVPVPVKLRASDNPFQWFGLLPAYSERLIEWGGQTLAVPLTGDGFVLVYRADRLADATVAAEFKKLGRPAPAVPATWEEFADVAAGFAAIDKKPSLPPLPSDPERAFDLFSRVASSIDREGLNDIQLAARAGQNPDAIAFYFSVVTGQSRLKSAGFRLAADWLARLKSDGSLPPDGKDPVVALTDGSAVMAVLSLDQLSQLPREGGAVPPRFGITGIPGTRNYYHANQGQVLPDPNSNYVPHFSGGRLGVVRTRCPHADAAFDLLAELGGPARSAELIATPGLGAGPTRIAHLDPQRLVVWLGYGFDETRSKAIQDAMRHYVEQAVKNPTLGLRGPDRGALVAAAGAAVRKIGTGTKADDALTEAEKAWQTLDAKVPPETLLRWRQRGAGLN